jgi:hypothetical protein
MQAIRTRYLPPTNVRSSRIQAKAEAGAVYMNYDHGLDTKENHRAACDKLLLRLKWLPQYGSYTAMVGGEFNGDYYWVFTERN